MPTIKILTETELRAAVQLDLEAVDCVEKGFTTLAQGSVVMPPIMSMEIGDFNGEVDVKTAYVPGFDSYAIKMASGFFDNPGLGLPSASGLMVLFSSRTGLVEAVLLDNGYLTDVRTAAAGAVAARHLSREDSRSACILGAGAQAQLQLQALCLVRLIERATIWARDRDKAATAAAECADRLGISVEAMEDAEAAVRGADVVITTTPSTSPLVMADWLQPGQHVTAMGSDQEHKNELEPACIAKADLHVPDRQAQTALLGELRPAIEAGIVAQDAAFAELGTVAAGMAPGRASPESITIADLTGTGVQDTVIATFARARAAESGAGTDIRS